MAATTSPPISAGGLALPQIESPGAVRLETAVRRVCRASLAAAMLVFFIAFVRLSFALLDRFAYMTFDLGIFDQGMWLIAHGQRPFVTARGLHILGDHFSVILYLLAPIYRLAPHPKTLLMLQTLALTLGAVPVYGLARKRLGSEPFGLWFGLLYLLYPAHQWSLTYEFHPDTFATPLLLTAFYALEAKQIRLYVVALALTALLKESAGLSIACVGVLAWRQNRRVSASTVVCGLTLLPFAMLTVRHFNAGQPSPYFAIFDHYGASPADITAHFVRRPLPFLADLFGPGNLYYVALLLAPLCFLPVLAPQPLLLTAPLLLVNFMARRPGMHSIEEYYNAFITPFLFLGAIIGFGRMLQWGWFTGWLVRLNAPIWAVFGILLSPLVRPVEHLYASHPPLSAVAECQTAIRLIPTNDSVSAVMALGPHLTRRTQMYAFPNPFLRSAYGGTRQALWEIDSATGTRLPDELNRFLAQSDKSRWPEWIALCPRSNPFPLSESEQARLTLALLQSRDYETAYAGGCVLVLHRTLSGQADLHHLADVSGRPVQTPKQIEAAYGHWLALQYPPPKGVSP